MSIGVSCHGKQGLQSKESHHVLLLSQEADVPNVQQRSYESISLFHGDEVYVVTSHTMDQYCPKKL